MNNDTASTSPLHERRAGHRDTQRALLDLLRASGPLQGWQIEVAIGKTPRASLQRLVKAGCVEQFEDDNRHPNPNARQPPARATYWAFVRDHERAQTKGVSDTTLEWAARVLRAAGWTVIPPHGIANDEKPQPSREG